jgi:GLPGLI family protein
MRKTSVYLLLILFAAFLSGCSSNKENFISEGVIEYDAVAIDKENPMADFAPIKMIVKFKNNVLRADLSAGMGLMKMAVISDANKGTVIESVKLFNNKFANILDSNQVKKEYATFPAFNLIETKDKKVIAGYKCKRMIVSFLDKKHPDFDVYYTDEINLQRSNWSTHFNQIPGVLMEYQLKKHGLEMRFTAKSVTKSDVEDSSFELPNDYQIISTEKMEEQFESFE